MYTRFFSRIFGVGLALLLTISSFSQKGLPPEQTTTASVNTVFPNQQDFKDSLVKNLKIPEG